VSIGYYMSINFFLRRGTPLKRWNGEITDTPQPLTNKHPGKREITYRSFHLSRGTTLTGEPARRSRSPEPPQVHLPCCYETPNIGGAARIVAHPTPVDKNLNIEHASAVHEAHLEAKNRIRHRRPRGRRPEHKSDAAGQDDSSVQPSTTGGDFPPRTQEKEKKTHIFNHGQGEDTHADAEAHIVSNPIAGEEMETTKETPEPRRSLHLRAKLEKHQTRIPGRDPPHALGIAKAEEQKPSTPTTRSCNRVTAAGEAPNRANPRRASRRRHLVKEARRSTTTVIHGPAAEVPGAPPHSGAPKDARGEGASGSAGGKRNRASESPKLL
jgi:hypothetical protein